MGVVYRALDPSLNRYVAIKVMSQGIAADQELRDRFMREARAAGSLQHPNIITIFDFGEFEGSLYIAMEYVEGSDLSVIMDRQDPLPLTGKLDIMIDVLHALDYAHHRRVVHRDVKPGNIRVAVDGRAKLMDFGIARLEKSDLTKSGMMIGTPDYMAPEQITGGEITPATDIFAVGAVLYEFLTGKQIWDGDSLHKVLYKVVHSEPAKLHEANPSVPMGLQPIVDRALAKDPAQRYASAGAMAEALTELRTALSGGATMAIRARRTPLRTMRVTEPLEPSQLPADSRAVVEPVPVAARKSGAGAAAWAEVGAGAAAAPRVGQRRPGVLIGVGAGVVVVVAAVVFAVTRPHSASRTGLALDTTAVAVTPATRVDSSAGSAKPGAQEPGVSRQEPAASAQVPAAPTTPAPAVAAPGRAGQGARTPARGGGAAGAAAKPGPAGQRADSVAALPLASRVAPFPGTAPASLVTSPAVTPGVTPTPQSPANAPASQPQAPVAPAATPPAPSPTAGEAAPAPVPAPDPGPALEQLIAAYARAISSRSVADIRRVYPALTSEQQRDWEQFFRSVSDIKAELAIVRQDVTGSSATLAVAGTYDYESGGRTQHQDVSFRATAALDAGSWKLTSVR